MANQQPPRTYQSGGNQPPVNYQQNGYQPQNGYQQQPNYGYNDNQAQVQFAVDQALKAKKKKKRKIILIVLAVIIAVFILFGILLSGGSDSDSGSDTNATGQAASTDDSGNNVGSYRVDYKSAEVKSEDGENILVVTYTFTNNSESAAAWDIVLDDTAFQNGVEIEHNYFDDDNDSYSKEIQPGISLDVKIAYTLNDTTSPVDIEVSESFSFTDDVYKITVPLQ